MSGTRGKVPDESACHGLFRPDGCLTPTFIRWLEDQEDCVLLETARPSRTERVSHVFLEPTSRIECWTLDQVEEGLKAVERASKQGLYAAGFLSYELGYAFAKGSHLKTTPSTPLLWMGVYEEPWIYDHGTKRFEQGQEAAGRLAEALGSSPYIPTLRELLPVPSISKRDFHAALTRIKQHIREGNTYQVNFSFKVRFAWEHPLADLYCQLRAGQRVAYSALLKCGRTSVLSFSPELFFRADDGHIVLKPMKGTAARGRGQPEDDRNRRTLQNSAKDQAENLMIVDLLRNDVGRIADVGTVSVPEFFALEEYETVFQATSVVQARLRPTCTFSDLIRSLFPSGSVTGAPKIRTMQIIQELEKEARGVYTGAIGFVAPRRRAVFNVAIRTIQVDTRQGQAEMGVGSGVTYDSDLGAEYRECLDKARFVGSAAGDFDLLETIRWAPDKGWFLLDEHLQRLQHSADSLGFSVDAGQVRGSLLAFEARLQDWSRARDVMRVRVVVNRDGDTGITAASLEPPRGVEKVAFAAERIDPHNRFLYHKTTNRLFYDRALREATDRGWFDRIFLNDRGEVTEGARSNVIACYGEECFTPPVSCGLLPGVYREVLLRGGRLALKEKILSPQEIQSADRLFCCNSVRGLQQVEIVEAPCAEVVSWKPESEP